jgi:hypothetical protein
MKNKTNFNIFYKVFSGLNEVNTKLVQAKVSLHHSNT